MKVVICEDEEKFANQLIDYINEWAKAKSTQVEIFSFIKAEEFLYEWEDREDYDIIFLDIKMGKMSGMDLAKIIRKTNNNLEIVFVTNMKEYVIKGYAVAAMQFLLKPVRKEDCFNCLNKVYQSSKIKKYYILHDLEKILKIPTDDIIYIEMFSHNATLVTVNCEYIERKTITQLLTELNDDLLVKCHKSYIINIRHLQSFSKVSAMMSNGSEIPISRDMASEINQKFMKYNLNKV